MVGVAKKSVCVAIVTYNSEHIVSEALQSIPYWADVVVVDNNSRRDIRGFLDENRVKILRTDENLGFGAACNIAARSTTADYIFFLNPDARIMGDALDILLEAAEELKDTAGAFAPLLVGPDGPVPPRAATLLESPRSTYLRNLGENPRTVDFVSGAALLIDRGLFLELGGFDEEIFLYLEDDDLCLRLRHQGRPPVLVPRAQVHHYEGSQSDTPSRLIRWKNFHTMRSYLYLAQKYNKPVRTSRLKLKAIQRLVLGIFCADRVRVAKNAGRLMALYGRTFR